MRTNTPPLPQDGPGRGDVLVDPDAAAPDRQHPADAVEERLAPAAGEGRRAAAEEPDPRLDGSACWTRNGSIQPRWTAADEEVAADAGRCSWPDVATRNRKTPKRTARARSRSDAIEERGPRLRASGRASRALRGRRRGRPPSPRARAGPPGPAASGRAGRPDAVSTGHQDRGLDRSSRARSRAGSGPADPRPHRRRRVERPAGVARRHAAAASSRRSLRRQPRPRQRPPSPRARPAPRHRPRRRTSAPRRPRTMISDAGEDEARREDLGGRDPEERPVVGAQVLEDEADDAVPDEEHAEQVAGVEPPAEAAGEEDQDQHAEEARERLVEEQRLEVRRRRRDRVGADAGRRTDDPVGALDRDAPRQVRRRPVQLLVEEVAPAGDRLHHEQARRDDVGPRPEGCCFQRV